MKSGRFGKLTKKAPTPDKPSLNRAPGQIHPTLSMSGQTVDWSPMWWGRPPGGRTGDRFPQPINARAETVGKKTSFRDSFENRRCLVPADGFYEWQVTDGEKYPYFIHLPDRTVFAMAGIWTEALDFEKTVGSFTILTQEAHPGLLKLHDRMPFILQESEWKTWMDPSSTTEQLQEILDYPGPEMTAYQVSNRVNSTKNDDPELQEPFSERQSTLF